jgi:NAD(P)-dependent dehydrogenase (short-subunit alcohol dehydrogenase family)
VNYLFVGAGRGIGQKLKNHYLAQGHKIFHITSGVDHECDYVSVDWAQLRECDLQRWLARLPSIDLIFFNQNSSSLSSESFDTARSDVLATWKQIAHWKQSHYVSCQLPFQIIHSLADRLHDKSRVCWMLSGMVVQHKQNFGYADYIANKFQNYLLMKNFSQHHPSCFLGIDPGNVSQIDVHDSAAHAIQNILALPTDKIDGKVYNIDGTVSHLFRVFE